MESSRAEDAVEDATEWQMLKVCLDQVHSAVGVVNRLTKHVQRQVDAYDTSAREALVELGGEAARTAAGVEHALVSAQA
jgi:hypothetical protein